MTRSTADEATRVEGSASMPLDDLSASGSFDGHSVALFDRLGRYVLLDRLGRGAFGAVWTAYDPQLDRKLAIKVVHARRSRRDAAAQAELLREAQLLAQLSHPNIVAIHDVGRLEDALPAATSTAEREPMVGVFIVMEHLSGPTLAEWLGGELEAPTGSEANANAAATAHVQRSSDEILRVFGEAGRGLSAAHARNLVHLDFKPGNVMFGLDGRVRVLDFGLAQIGRREGIDERKRKPNHKPNHKHRVAGTPAYMAPEQHEGKPADARADQYAFCVSLWEALYGQRPFVGDTAEALYLAKRGGPPKPSPGMVRLPHVHAALERGLAVAPEQRHASINALLDALEDDPRLRRRRWAAGIVIVGALIGAGFGLARASGEQADPCALPDGQFEGVWDQARREQVEAAFAATEMPYAGEAFAQVAEDLDQRIAQWSTLRRGVCRDALVDATLPVEQMSEQLLCLDRYLRSIAGVSAALRSADAEVVARARVAVLELDDPERCLTSRSSADEPEHARTADAAMMGPARRTALLQLEDALAGARVARELGRYQQAEIAVDQAITQARELDEAPALARALRERGVILRELGRVDEARDASMDALTAAAALANTELESQILADLIATHTTLGEFGKAVALSEIALARIDPTATPALAVEAHLRAAAAHDRQQHWDASIAELEAALALANDSDVSNALLGEAHLNYGSTLLGSGRDLARGEAEYQKALELWTAALGSHHPTVSRARMNLGTVYFRRGEYDTAIELYESALAEFEQIYPDDHPFVGACHQNLGASRWVAGDLAGALRHTRESLAVAEHKLGREHPDYASNERNLATIMTLRGDYREAEPHFVHAAAVYAATLDPGDSRVLASNAELAEIAWWLGDVEQAHRRGREVAAALEQVEAGDPRRLGPLSTLALLAMEDGDFALAETHATTVVEFGQALLGPTHPDLARARILLGEVLRRGGQLGRARTELELALQMLTRDDGSHPFAWAALLELGRLEHDEGHDEAAREHLEAALARAEQPDGAPVHAAIVALELAATLESSTPARATTLREQALETLRSRGVRPDLVAAHSQ